MPTSTDGAARTAEALLDVLHGVHKLMRTSLHTADRRAHSDEPGGGAFPEKRGQFKLLIVLTKRGRASMHELAAALGVTPPTVTGMVRRLLERGYVERVRDDADWRTVWVELTEHGREVVTRHHRERVAALERRIAQLEPEERARLRDAIPVLARLLEIEPDAAPAQSAPPPGGFAIPQGAPAPERGSVSGLQTPAQGTGSTHGGGHTNLMIRAEERRGDAGDT